MRTFIFCSIYTCEEIHIEANSLDEAWKKLEEKGFRKENYMYEGAQ